MVFTKLPFHWQRRSSVSTPIFTMRMSSWRMHEMMTGMASKRGSIFT